MSLPMDLDEYSEETLLAEIDRRVRARADGNCDYCNRRAGVPLPNGNTSCRFPSRHYPTPRTPTRQERLEAAARQVLASHDQWMKRRSRQGPAASWVEDLRKALQP